MPNTFFSSLSRSDKLGQLVTVTIYSFCMLTWDTHAQPAGKNVMHQFPPDALQESGANPEAPPFAVVASTTADLRVGRFWPVRKYPW